MKRTIPCCALLLALFPALTACGGSNDYTPYLSEIRRDVFRAETEEFSVTLSCIEREYPYADDGVACPRVLVAELVLVPAVRGAESYAVYVVGEKTWGGEASFRNVQNDFFYSESMETFPEGRVTVRVEWGGETREAEATSVRTETTLTPEEALARAVEAEAETVSRMTRDGAFRGEFRVRLLRRDRNYYFVGIVGTDGTRVCLLLDAESGAVLARRAGP